MNIDELKHVLDLVREHDLAELELEYDGVKLRIRKHPAQDQAAPTSVVTPGIVAPVTSPVSGRSLVPAPESPPVRGDGNLVEAVELAVVTAPMVGTFYRAPSPGAPSFVEVGAIVKRGQVLCIIEAMKLMNEIESDYAGELVQVYVENGQPVQYGERLFALRR